MSKKRVVITGLSALTPLGNSLETTWRNLLDGKSGIGPITLFDATDYDARIAGEVKNFKPEEFGIAVKQVRRMDRFAQFAVAGAYMLMPHSGYQIGPDNEDRIAVMLGAGLGGLDTIEKFHTKLMEAGPSRVSPFMIPMLISNMGTGQVAMATGAKGSNLALTSACSSGLHAIGHAYTEIVMGRCDAVITGGMEATITPMGISGFTAMKALSTAHNDDPQKASRPFDKNRDGFVMGEGAGMLLLESLESAKKRGAAIYAEIVGFGASCDAIHMTAPDEHGAGIAKAMRYAMAEAGVRPEEVTHINAHGTSTHLNDLCETRGIKSVFGAHAKNIAICANKSQLGHLLGGAGGIESVISVMTLHTGIVPGTINLEEPGEECDLNYMANGPETLNPRYALCNSLGFGGTNVSILYKRYEE